MQAPLDAIADPDWHVMRAPEIGEGVSREPGLHVLVDRDAPRRLHLRGAGREVRRAGREIRREAVLPEGPDICRVERLDAEPTQLRRGEGDRHVVPLGAEHRLAGARALDGERVLGTGAWGCGNQSRDHDDGLHAMTGPTRSVRWTGAPVEQPRRLLPGGSAACCLLSVDPAQSSTRRSFTHGSARLTGT